MRAFWCFVIILIVLFVLALTAQYAMGKKTKTEVSEELFKKTVLNQPVIVQEADLANLPVPVQKWLRNSGVVGKEKIQTVRLKQVGELRTDAQKSWMSFTAEQYTNFEQPGFIWYARIHAAPLLHIAGRDKYVEGKGNMLIKFMSLVKVADSTGAEMNSGSLIRYLAEIIWTPSAALNDYITWESVNEYSARATITYQGVSASGVFEFDEEGNAIGFSAKRYRDLGGHFSLDDWHISVEGNREFDGIVIPAEGEVTWRLPDGDFNWFRFKIERLEYNQTLVY